MMRGHHPRSQFLNRRLAELSRKRADRLGSDAPEPGESVSGLKNSCEGKAAGSGDRLPPAYEAVSLEEIVPGAPLEDSEGVVFLHEQLRSQIEKRQPYWGKLARENKRKLSPFLHPPAWQETPWRADYEAEDWELREESTLDDVPLPLEVLHLELQAVLQRGLGGGVYLDLETCGLSQACVFLAGTMQWNGEDFVVRQYLARDYSEERGLLFHLSRYLAQADYLITFNGKAFDIPLLRDRATMYGVTLRLPSVHVDLLHHARARWRNLLPNCKLTTLEAYICNRRRTGDVPGSEIPGVYHQFVKQGNPYPLIPVLHHNLLDVITMDEILREVVAW